MVFRTHSKRAKLLPVAQQRKLAALLIFLQQNPYDTRLHTKRLSARLTGLLSFRIGRDWRVLFRFLDEETIMLVDVGHRRDMYR